MPLKVIPISYSLLRLTDFCNERPSYTFVVLKTTFKFFELVKIQSYQQILTDQLFFIFNVNWYIYVLYIVYSIILDQRSSYCLDNKIFVAYFCLQITYHFNLVGHFDVHPFPSKHKKYTYLGEHKQGFRMINVKYVNGLNHRATNHCYFVWLLLRYFLSKYSKHVKPLDFVV